MTSKNSVHTQAVVEGVQAVLEARLEVGSQVTWTMNFEDYILQ